jgi:hypothetical protein
MRPDGVAEHDIKHSPAAVGLPAISSGWLESETDAVDRVDR